MIVQVNMVGEQCYDCQIKSYLIPIYNSTTYIIKLKIITVHCTVKYNLIFMKSKIDFLVTKI